MLERESCSEIVRLGLLYALDQAVIRIDAYVCMYACMYVRVFADPHEDQS